MVCCGWTLFELATVRNNILAFMQGCIALHLDCGLQRQLGYRATPQQLVDVTLPHARGLGQNFGDLVEQGSSEIRACAVSSVCKSCAWHVSAFCSGRVCAILEPSASLKN